MKITKRELKQMINEAVVSATNKKNLKEAYEISDKNKRTVEVYLAYEFSPVIKLPKLGDDKDANFYIDEGHDKVRENIQKIQDILEKQGRGDLANFLEGIIYNVHPSKYSTSTAVYDDEYGTYL